MSNPSPNGMFDHCPNFVTCNSLALSHDSMTTGADGLLAMAVPDSPEALNGQESPTGAGPAFLKIVEALEANAPPADGRCVGCWLTAHEVQVFDGQVDLLPETPEPPLPQ